MLVLDSEAISALANGPRVRRDRVRALIRSARDRELPVGTVAAVLAEVVRGRPADAGIFATIGRGRVVVMPVDRALAVRAGQILGATRARSSMAVDAFVVAGAELAGGGVVATVDVDDLRRLAAHASGVEVHSIQPARRLD